MSTYMGSVGCPSPVSRAQQGCYKGVLFILISITDSRGSHFPTLLLPVQLMCNFTCGPGKNGSLSLVGEDIGTSHGPMGGGLSP